MTVKTYVTEESIYTYQLWKDKLSTLTHLTIELTERCNNNCIHCCINLPADDLDSKKRELSTQRIKEILKEASFLGCLSVRFTGGEPFLREDFEELYIFARKQGLKVVIFTNATLITPRLAGLFASIPPLEPIEISFYGMKKASYEAVTRAPGSFERAKRGINLLLEHKVPFVIKGAILSANKEELEEFDAWAAAISWMNEPPSYAVFFNLHCRRNEDRNRLIRNLRTSPQEGLKVLTHRQDVCIEEMRKTCARLTKLGGEKLFLCEAGRTMGCVDAYGIFQPCMLLRHPDCVYDLKKGSIKDARENFFPEIKKMKATNKEFLAHCARCFLRGICEQCPAKSWIEHGTLDTPAEYLCEITHTQARFLGLLKDNEMAWEVTDWQERIKNFTKGDIYGKKS